MAFKNEPQLDKLLNNDYFIELCQQLAKLDKDSRQECVKIYTHALKQNIKQKPDGSFEIINTLLNINTSFSEAGKNQENFNHTRVVTNDSADNAESNESKKEFLSIFNEAVINFKSLSSSTRFSDFETYVHEEKIREMGLTPKEIIHILNYTFGDGVIEYVRTSTEKVFLEKELYSAVPVLDNNAQKSDIKPKSVLKL